MARVTFRRISGFGLAAALALGVAGAATAQEPATVTRETEFCASLGPKRPGTAADRAMADHVEARFREAGLQTSTESFHLPAFHVRSERVEVIAPTAQTVSGQAFAYSGVGTVEAPVVYVGTGRSSDYLGIDAVGKIVMVDRNEAYHRSSQLTEVVAHGGAAMLYVSGSPSNLVQAGAVRFAQDLPAPIPTMTIGSDDGDALQSQAQNGTLKMRLTVDAVREDVVGRNVIGVRRGTTYPDRYVVVGGHYDSWHAGAIDNCSAIGSMLQVLDETRDLQPAYTVVYAAWDAEEVGLVGSYDWVMGHPDLVARTVLNENLEMTSAATYAGDQQLPTSLLNVMFGTSAPALNALVYEAAARNAFVPAPTTASGVRAISGGIIPTDLQPFYTAGVQGFSTFSSSPYYHTTEDLPDKIDPASHVRVTNYLRDVLRDAQSVPPEALTLREVPLVVVTAPTQAPPGAPITVDVAVTDPLGQPLDGADVRVVADQRDHWAVTAGAAAPLGAGRYRYVVAAGTTTRDLTRLTASVESPLYAAQGYATVDQREGAPACPAFALGASVATTAGSHGLRVRASSAVAGTGVAVVQEARGRRIVRPRLVAGFELSGARTKWNGRDGRGRRLPDGIYTLRVPLPDEGGFVIRKAAFSARGGRLKVLAPMERHSGCGALRSVALVRPVFGGPGRRALSLSYRPAVPARVIVKLVRRGRVIAQLAAIDRSGAHTYRVRLAGGRRLRRGSYEVQVAATRQDGSVTTVTVGATRL